MNTEIFHNPQNLDSPGIGFSFIPKGSLKEEGDEVWDYLSKVPRWIASNLMNGIALQHDRTYRRKLTQPKEEGGIKGTWRHSNGMIFCGTLRIAKADFDTDPSQEFKDDVFDQICNVMNRVKPPEPTKREEGEAQFISKESAAKLQERFTKKEGAMLEAAKPLIKWVNENCHPHCKIILDHTHVELLEGQAIEKTTEFLKD